MNNSVPVTSIAKAGVRGLRWWIVGLVFLATFINFIDRLTISVLAPVITTQLGLTNLQYASITTWFLVAYTASQGLSGKLYDRIGTRRGFTISILVWSIAAMSHAIASSALKRFARRLRHSPPTPLRSASPKSPALFPNHRGSSAGTFSIQSMS